MPKFSFKKGKRILGLGALFLALTSCWARQGLPVEKISEPALLEQAKVLPVSGFFALRMENRPRKALVGQWLILHEDAQFVYLGYPRFDGILSDSRSVSEFYKTQKSELLSEFPGYRSIGGNDVRLAAQSALQQKTQTSVALPWEKWQAKLNQRVIQVSAEVALAEQVQKYTVELDASDLKLISVRSIAD
ncbi:hypothetical protein COW36_17985 [bacterium (Candidatus Blackallbacteria) CG17_big_fil_post_rev_8_21_14_2_50_48_46]|uniref:Outer-membrane lipoprotein LolB n=1 Tax=bacterium (Candidatus Blackallbacteria) CG17_big_fil_post_rev_8_21_14_2_50_48_46 TaxID=2014261 RepID=A0A2M7G0Y8_9BACT|nr:MAG: hypothetical protein COW64_00740 [bacterium (Candidatus Blackallbacteria) CG18_big_fil_WC_8_21_14_2_50_49_26]PIW15306.1 MAG: hypothetical protein COW36_17985 [bacterium (Candidatus Blackallbacteria) CG17_big_fil_post_rev_8_21_14_2_50_48_46]PIW45184.1 MAG: hypothetical protein COW20_21030 [bacterium (Candidatus Blackallbacteria) CG13_big_fil_rev_8_21_14_2_50_49_14]